MTEQTTIEELGAIVEIMDQFTPAENVEPQTVGEHPMVSVGITIMEHSVGLPEYKTDLASGFDLNAANFESIHLNSIGASAMIPTGIKLEVPVGFEAQVRPRSGLAAKHGIIVTNTPGTIDADYRGELFVLLTNLHGKRFSIERGDRIAQVIIAPVVQAQFRVTDVMSETDRGEGAFGSTGV